MPKVILSEHNEVISLAETISNLEEIGFDPRDDESIINAAYQLRGLYNDREFLSNIIMHELEDRCKNQNAGNAYSGQSIMLHSRDNIVIRANIWPGKEHYLMRANGDDTFYFNKPHDHNFDFLTVGYLGPGYASEYYEYDYDKVVGYEGEPVDLKYIETSCLEEGKILHYRAHKDVHNQLPAQSLSVSINIMHQNMVQPWYDQYHFDLSSMKIVKILNHISSEVLLKMAVNLLPEAGEALAHEYLQNHSCDRMRRSALEALLSNTSRDSAEDIIAKTCHNSSTFMRNEAQNRLKFLAMIRHKISSNCIS